MATETKSQLDRHLRIRLSAAEVKAIEAKAREADRTVSDWVRLTLRQACGRK